MVGEDWDIYGRRVGNTGMTEPAFNISVAEWPAAFGSEERNSAAGGSPEAMAVWKERWQADDWNVHRRFLCYRAYPPPALR